MKRETRKDLKLLVYLLSRWRERYIWRALAIAEMVSLIAASIALYYVDVLGIFAPEQMSLVIAITYSGTIISNALGIGLARRLTAGIEEFLRRPDRRISPEEEEVLWREATSFSRRFSLSVFWAVIASSAAVGIVLFLTLFQMRLFYSLYLFIVGFITAVWMYHYYFFISDWILWPVRRELFRRSVSLRPQYLAGSDIYFRMATVFSGLVLILALMLGVLAYRGGQRALAPGANPVLVLSEVQNAVLFIGLLGVSVSMGFAWLLARSVALPLRNLVEIMAEVERGNLSLRGEVISADETAYLTIAFNQMMGQLQEFQTGLERLVAQRTADLARRTAQLEGAAVIARRAAEIRDIDTLLNETVPLISDRFGFYHAGIFLLDERGEYAVLQAASSEGGQRMLARGYRLAVGEGSVVGLVAETGKPRIVSSVETDALFSENPDLPLTRSAAALPLKVEERVIGVLDVHSDRPSAFSEEDITVLQTTADQIALAIENIRTLRQMERMLQELERVYGEYTRQAWRAMRRARRWVGRRYRRLVPESAEEWTEEARQALSEGRLVLGPIREEGDGRVIGTLLAVPIKLRGQVIGVLNLRFATPEVPSETVRVVEAIAERLALALETARLLEESRLHAERDRRIAEITARVRASLDPEAVLRTAAQQLGAALGVDRVIVQMIPGMMTAGEPPARSE